MAWRGLAVGVIVAGLAAGAAAQAPRDPAVHFSPAAAPAPTPEYTFTAADGRKATLADFRGKTVLVNFWATWCVPCVKEMPALDRLQAEMGGADFAVVTISLDRAGNADVAPFFKKVGIKNLPDYIDPKWTAMRAFGLKGLPTSLLVDGQGREVGRVEGDAEWTADSVRALIGKHVKPAG